MKRIEISKLLSIIMLVALILLGSQLSDSFLSVRNFSNIIQYAVETALISIGMALVLLIGGIDLSVGSVLAFSTVVSAKMALAGANTLVILLVTIVIGFVIGAINGLLITKVKVEAFMATLGTMMVMRACTFLFTGGGPLTGSIKTGFQQIIKGKFLSIQYGIFYVVILFVIAGIILSRTRFGRHIYAVGGGEETAKLFGVQVDKVKMSVYIISGILAALAGMIIAARIGIGEPRSGYGFEMTAITVCVVGGVSMTGGKGTVTGTFIGLMVISIIKNLMNLMNIDTNAQPIVNGVIILIVALIVSREMLGKRRSLVKQI